MSPSTRRNALAAASALLLACGGGDAPQAPAAIISPGRTAVLPSGQQGFTSAIARAVDNGVTWSIVEAGGGNITSSGLYTAPSSTGTYHVKATSVADPTLSATATVEVTLTLPDPPAGNPNAEATCSVPTEAAPADVSSPTTVVGRGTPDTCTGDEFVAAVAKGGVVTFKCGPAPVTIRLGATARVPNDKGDVVIDGGGLVTLSGDGAHRILYMNTCDQDQYQDGKYTTDHCQNQDHPRLTVQNITFVDGNSKADTSCNRGRDVCDGGGAIWVRGGRFKVLNSRFFDNVCEDAGPDVGGAAVRVFSQYQGLPVYVVNSTFGGGDGYGGACSNGGGVSSIGVSWTIINSLFSYNRAIGNGGNPAQNGTPGGGSGGAIYNDGNRMTLSLCGSRIEHNQVNRHGSAIFFVSNDKTGDIRIDRSVITNNLGGSWYPTYPQISNHSETPIVVTNSVIQ